MSTRDLADRYAGRGGRSNSATLINRAVRAEVRGRYGMPPETRAGFERPDRMKAKVRRRPICLYCGTPLRLHTRTIDVLVGETPEESAARAGFPPENITRVHRNWRGVPFLVSCWTGRFGPEGDDRFCSKGHGYRYAVERVAPAVRWED